MNKYLMISVAALFAGTAAAQAAQPSGSHTRDFVFGTSNGGSFCDGGSGSWSGLYYTWVHTNTDCAGGRSAGTPGLEGKTRGVGPNVTMSDTGYSGSSSAICSYIFPPKFKIGGAWGLLCEFSGSIPVLVNGGVLKAPDPARPNRNGKSSSTLVKAMIAERRAQKEISR